MEQNEIDLTNDNQLLKRITELKNIEATKTSEARITPPKIINQVQKGLTQTENSKRTEGPIHNVQKNEEKGLSIATDNEKIPIEQTNKPSDSQEKSETDTLIINPSSSESDDEEG